jgi:putative FmdB family regulatory protein
MPIYEYECGQCGHHFEALQKISEELLVYCPECGESELKKKVSAAAFRLKGTGWYETDFKHSESEKKANSEKDSNQKSEKEGTPPASEQKTDGKTKTTGDKNTVSAKSEPKSESKSNSSGSSTKSRDSGPSTSD